MKFTADPSVAKTHISIGHDSLYKVAFVSFPQNDYGLYALNSDKGMLLSSGNVYQSWISNGVLRDLMNSANIYAASFGSFEVYVNMGSGLGNSKIYSFGNLKATFPAGLDVAGNVNFAGNASLQDVSALALSAQTISVTGTASFVDLAASGTMTSKKFAATGTSFADRSTLGQVEMTALTVQGNATIAGTLTENSDIRLKENIQELSIEECLQDTMALRPVIYNKKDTGAEEIGFIAQEVEAVLPVAVSENPDEYLSVSYTRLIPVLVGAIQELTAQVTELKKRLGEG